MSRPIVLNTVAEVDAWAEKETTPIAAVLTMGALHQGHAELVRYAKANTPSGTRVIATIFVNPTQFNNSSDLAEYPRTLDSDLDTLQSAGADAVFIPTASEMYPAGETKIGLTHYQIGNDLEGASRPGHFEGMLTVVTKLLNITKPIATFFGEKDFQQLVLVKQLVSDLNMEINVIGVPTVRDKDGFALSSRNKRLSQTQRELASQIPATLTLLKRSISEGHELTSAINIATEYLTNFPEIKIDYLELRNQQLGKPSNTDSVRALIAVQIGEIRLIDNMTVRD
jgi:pantoate--beta-alanine ligase